MADSKTTIWTRIETNFSAHKTLHVPCKLTWPQVKPVPAVWKNVTAKGLPNYSRIFFKNLFSLKQRCRLICLVNGNKARRKYKRVVSGSPAATRLSTSFLKSSANSLISWGS